MHVSLSMTICTVLWLVIEQVVSFCKENNVELIVVGPEVCHLLHTISLVISVCARPCEFQDML